MTDAPDPTTTFIPPAPTPFTYHPFDLPLTLEPGCCRCEIRNPKLFGAHDDIIVSWLGYHELAGLGERHNGLKVMRVIEYTIDGVNFDDGRARHRAHVEPIKPPRTEDGEAETVGWCYSGTLVVPKDWLYFPYKCALQLHATPEELNDYINEYKKKTGDSNHG